MNKNKFKVNDYSGNFLVSFSRGLRLGFTNFRRNKFLSGATIIVMAVIIFIFNIILGVQFIGNQALKSLSERVDIVIYLQNDIDFFTAKKLTLELENLEGVKSVKFTSKEEALDIISKTHPKTAEFLKKFNLTNPLPPSISITTHSAEDHQTVQNFLNQSEYKNLISTTIPEGAGNESIILSNVAQNLQNISSFIKQIIFWMVLVFILGGTLIVVNAIQITTYSRRQEIHIMRLVGATPNFIRLPFVFEAVLYAIFAIIISFFILVAISGSIHLDQSNLWVYYSNINLARIFTIELIITTILAVVSSFSATEQYIKGKLNLN